MPSAFLLLIFIINILFLNAQNDLFPDYYKINRGDTDVKVYGYDARHAAILTKKENNYYVTIQKVNGFHKSNPVKISPSNNTIFACFHHNGKDYLWYKENNTHFLSKIYSPPNFVKTLNIEFDLLSFDHLRGDVLFSKNKSLSIYPFSYFLSRNRSVLANPIRSFRTNLTCSDIIFVDGKIYCTNNFTVYKIPIPNGMGKWMANYYINRFQFALFPKILSTMSICQVGMGSAYLEIILYIIDLFIIVILIYLLRDKIKEASPADLLKFRRPRNRINIEQELTEFNTLTVQNPTKNDSG